MMSSLFGSLFCCYPYNFVLRWTLAMLIGSRDVVWAGIELLIQVILVPQLSKKLGPQTCATITGNPIGSFKMCLNCFWILLALVGLRSGSHGHTAPILTAVSSLKKKKKYLFICCGGRRWVCVWRSEVQFAKVISPLLPNGSLGSNSGFQHLPPEPSCQVLVFVFVRRTYFVYFLEVRITRMN